MLPETQVLGGVERNSYDFCGMIAPSRGEILHTTESLILAQNERWRRGSGMQVERENRASV